LQYDAFTAFHERVRSVFSVTVITESEIPFILKPTYGLVSFIGDGIGDGEVTLTTREALALAPLEL
jgi:hypothetical protein